jgi:hypothetical protein
MDRAIDVCRSLKAIVLVIPYQTIVLDRGNHIVSLVNQMKQRYPNILEKSSRVFERFFILITKWNSTDNSRESIAQRFNDLCSEATDVLAKSKSNILEVEAIEDKIRIFSALKTLCK